MLQTLLEEYHRISSLDFYARRPTPVVKRMLATEAPALESFACQGLTNRFDEFDLFPNQQLPSLKTLSLIRVPFHKFTPLFRPQVAHLTLEISRFSNIPSIGALLTALSKLPALESLSIRTLNLSISDHEDAHSISLQRLRSLTIISFDREAATLLDHIIFPSTASLRISTSAESVSFQTTATLIVSSAVKKIRGEGVIGSPLLPSVFYFFLEPLEDLFHSLQIRAWKDSRTAGKILVEIVPPDLAISLLSKNEVIERDFLRKICDELPLGVARSIQLRDPDDRHAGTDWFKLVQAKAKTEVLVSNGE